MMKEKKHAKFLEYYIETRDIQEAARLAGIDNPKTMQNYFCRYKNIYRALFEKLNLPEEAIIKSLINITQNAGRDADRLKAIELCLRLIGALEETKTEINVINQQEVSNEELNMYNKLKEKPELMKELLKIVSDTNTH